MAADPPPPPPGWTNDPAAGQQPPPPAGGYEAPPYASPYEPPSAPGALPPPPVAYEPPTNAYVPPHEPAAHQPPPPGAYPPPPPGAPGSPGGPGYSHPNWAPPGPPPRTSNNRRIWTIVLSILAVLVLGIGACTVWFVGTVKAPVDESNRFLAEIDAGDYAAAAARTDPACNNGMTAGQLEAIFGGADITYDLKSSSITNNSATVSGSFSATNLSLRTVEIYLRNSDGWRICGFDAR